MRSWQPVGAGCVGVRGLVPLGRESWNAEEHHVQAGIVASECRVAWTISFAVVPVSKLRV